MLKQGGSATDRRGGQASTVKVGHGHSKSQHPRTQQPDDNQGDPQQPFIILQRSPNVVNHFSLAPNAQRDSTLSGSPDKYAKHGGISVDPKHKRRTKTLTDHLPAIVGADSKPFGHAHQHYAGRERATPGHSD